MRALSAFIAAVSGICRIAVGLVFAVLIVTVAIQVFTRTFSASSPIWTEELSRFMLLYLAAFGVGLSYRTGDLVNVDIVQEAVSDRASWWMRFVSAVATAGLALAMIWPAWRFTTIGAMQSSPSLRWSMDIIHASVLVLAAALFLFALLRVVGMLAGVDDGRTQFAEDD